MIEWGYILILLFVTWGITYYILAGQRDRAFNLLLKYDRVINSGNAIMFVRDAKNNALSDGLVAEFIRRFRGDIFVSVIYGFIQIVQKSPSGALIKRVQFDRHSEGMLSIDLKTRTLSCWFVSREGAFVYEEFKDGRQSINKAGEHSGH